MNGTGHIIALTCLQIHMTKRAIGLTLLTTAYNKPSRKLEKQSWTRNHNSKLCWKTFFFNFLNYFFPPRGRAWRWRRFISHCTINLCCWIISRREFLLCSSRYVKWSFLLVLSWIYCQCSTMKMKFSLEQLFVQRAQILISANISLTSSLINVYAWKLFHVASHMFMFDACENIYYIVLRELSRIISTRAISASVRALRSNSSMELNGK